MQKKWFLALTGTAMLLGACAHLPRRGPVGNRDVPQPARSVDLSKYMGRWYEQFRYEAWFEKNMDEVTADYSLNADGTVKVVNRGRHSGDSGGFKQSVGKAKISDSATNAKLKVSFFGPFYGDYWILDHDDDYDWSIVGEPSGRYLWVLTRTAHPSPEILDGLKARVQALGYDGSLIRVTTQ
ncbi:lipocalin family protein [Paraburkholderia sp. DGU8]|jgi:apolipoprotein D and lipocalin family protein|uniref:lipocalin family protein n=1 Tax=Paraburkholderia sp. DGU8 TaxID=3161997 RepID=UPI003465D676